MKKKGIAALINGKVIKTARSVTSWCEFIFWTQEKKNYPIKPGALIAHNKPTFPSYNQTLYTYINGEFSAA
jgi:hypothetical protein